jgi:hypothetical protein
MAPRRRHAVTFIAAAILAALVTQVAIELSGHAATLTRLFRWSSILIAIGWCTVLNWAFTGVAWLYRRLRPPRHRTHRRATDA